MNNHILYQQIRLLRRNGQTLAKTTETDSREIENTNRTTKTKEMEFIISNFPLRKVQTQQTKLVISAKQFRKNTNPLRFHPKHKKGHSSKLLF